MNNKRTNPQSGGHRELPECVLVANIAHPNQEEIELAIVSDEQEWGDLPTAIYLRDDSAG